MRKDKVKPEEREYVKQNCLTTTDEAMAKYLNRDVRTIRSIRKSLGILKTLGGRLEGISTAKAVEAGQIALHASQKLTDNQRKEFYKTQFQNSLYYSNLKEQFTPSEIDFYLEEWGTLCLQFEDIVATEKRQIDELIKVSIMENRVLRNIKIAEEEIISLQKEVEELRKSTPDMSNDEAAQERDTILMQMIRTMSGQSSGMANDHHKHIEMKNKLLNELNARRKDRVDQISKRGTTFSGLVTAFRDRQVRESHGRHMELVRMAKEKKKNDWRKPTKFPDSSEDCILMDEYSQLPEKEIVMLKDMKSKLVEKYSKIENNRILIVDDDMRRSQFFGEVFKNNKIEYASNAEKALGKLKESRYDLVCLDYDLGLFQKGSVVADYIIENKLLSDTDILVQSMNKHGSELIKEKLVDARFVEAFPFEDIVKYIGESNAKNSIDAGKNESSQPNVDTR